MLAIERSERASITTGKDVRKNVAEGDPLDDYGYWGRLRRRYGHIAAPGVPATSLASLVSLAGTPGYADDTLRVFRPNKRMSLPDLSRTIFIGHNNGQMGLPVALLVALGCAGNGSM